MQVHPQVRKIPWSRKRQPTPAFLLKNSVDRGDSQATVQGATKSWIQLSTHTSPHNRRNREAQRG